MPKMKMFAAVLKDGDEAHELYRLALDREDFERRCGDGREVVRFIDRTEYWPLGTRSVRKALEEYGFSEEAVEAVLSCLVLGYENVDTW